MGFDYFILYIKRGVLSTGRTGNIQSVTFRSFIMQELPLFPAELKKAFIGTGILMIIMGAFSLLFYGEITSVDIFGSIISAPIFAYLMHLIMEEQKRI